MAEPGTIVVPAASGRLTRTCALDDRVSRLRHVSGQRLAALERMGVRTVRDLFLHLPRRYLDFSHVVPIAQADVGQEATVVGRIDRVELKRPRPRLPIVEVFVMDDTGVLRASFFKQPWLKDAFSVGDTVALSGKVTFAYGFKQMASPFHEVLGPNETGGYSRVVPVHPVSEGLTPAWMRRIASCAVADFSDACDFLPASLVAARGLMGWGAAVRAAHFPTSLDEAERARRRLAYDELLCLQLVLRARHALEGAGRPGFSHTVDGPHVAALLDALPFTLTGEQRAAVDDILADMASPRPMNRLLLGDVGTGKTAVAAVAMAACADSGTQCAVMAPTSVLARQYAEKMGPVLDAAGVTWRLLTGSTSADERASVTGGVASGAVTVLFGTTAILSEDVRFRDLSLAVVDEQHRFGVNQRTGLKGKGEAADVLTMTATPIPRTLALSVYGDVCVSSIRERPHPGAGTTTTVVPPESLDIAFGAIREEVAAGHQAYVVCPLVDDADDGSELDDVPEGTERTLKSARAAYEELSRSVFPDLSVGLIHGRMAPAEKDAAMAAFRDGAVDVLVSTTVIEVGVDVPNACAMLVYDADRFGLATLHQLRGRVGRGTVAGRVFLETSSKKGTPARKRLAALEQSTDGLELAELDLRLRHEGDVLGYRQSGAATLALVDLAEDGDLVEAAHGDALALLEASPDLSAPVLGPLAHEVEERFTLYFKDGGGA